LVFGPSEKVYHRFVLLKTLATLAHRTALDLPADIRSLIEAVYDNRPEGDEESAIHPAELRAAWATWTADVAAEADQAKRYLIPEPDERAFKLARIRVTPFEDDETDATSYFTAKTRLGNDTRQCLVLEGSAFNWELAAERPPARGVLAEMCRNLVNLPRWWLSDGEAEPGFLAPADAAPWLPGTMVLRLQAGEWRGRGRRGAFIIRDDQELGLIREEAKGA
jgi:hypothetical protein